MFVLQAATCSSYDPSNSSTLRLAPLPSAVYTEAKTLTPIPKGPLNGYQTRELLTEVRKSELRKRRALRSAVGAHEKQRKYVASRGKQR